MTSSHGPLALLSRAALGILPSPAARRDALAIPSEHHRFDVPRTARASATGAKDIWTTGSPEGFDIAARTPAGAARLYHRCMENHMAQGMIGIYGVPR